MGCASSTPMIASADSDILKMATHAVEDAKETAEDTVQDISQSLGKTIDTAKSTVLTAVTDLGTTVHDKTNDVKNTLMETLHLNGTSTGDAANEDEGSANEKDAKDIPSKSETMTKQAEDEELSGKSTPALDLDSLKTSTPEPEIEQAMANSEEIAPPTPKPTLTELKELKVEIKQATSAAEEISHLKDQPDKPSRLVTTEWEKFADSLWMKRKLKGSRPVFNNNALNNVWIQRADSSCFSDGYDESPSSGRRRGRTHLHKRKSHLNWRLTRNLSRSLISRAFLTSPTNNKIDYLKLTKPNRYKSVGFTTMPSDNTREVRFGPPSLNLLHNARNKKILPSYGINSRLSTSLSLSDSDSQEYLDRYATVRPPIIPRSIAFIPERTHQIKKAHAKSKILQKRFPPLDSVVLVSENHPMPSSRFIQPPQELPLGVPSTIGVQTHPPSSKYLNASSKPLPDEKSFMPLLRGPRFASSQKRPIPEVLSKLRRTCSVNSLSSSSDCVVVRPLYTAPGASPSTFLSLPHTFQTQKNMPLTSPLRTLTDIKNDMDHDKYSAPKSGCKSKHKIYDVQDFSSSKDRTSVAVDRCVLSPNRRKHNEHSPNTHKSFNQCAVCHKTFVVED